MNNSNKRVVRKGFELWAMPFHNFHRAEWKNISVFYKLGNSNYSLHCGSQHDSEWRQTWVGWVYHPSSTAVNFTQNVFYFENNS